jgi:hypothetical protein
MGKSGEGFRSLRIISLTLNFFIGIAFVGRPFLEHFKKHGWQSDSIPPVLLSVLGLFFLVCVYVSVGATAYYFSRAMRNINFFTQARLVTPWSAWLMAVPVVNMVTMPYVWGRTYYCSRGLHPMHHVTKQGAAAVSVGAFVLMLTGMATGIVSDNRTIWPPGYDGFSLSFMSICISVAGAMLFTRIVQRISAVQELYAERVGVVARWRNSEDDSINGGLIDLLKTVGVGACLGLALFTAVWPAVTSSAAQQLLVAGSKQVTRIEGAGLKQVTRTEETPPKQITRTEEPPLKQVTRVEEARPTREQILQVMADKLNKAVPQQIDTVTRLDRVRVEVDRFVHEYTLNVATRLRPDAISKAQRQVRSNSIPAFCLGEMKSFRQLNAALVYRYRYPSGELVYEVIVAERDCK